MGHTFLLTAALTLAVLSTSVAAQNAFRCEVNGKVAYSDIACAPGAAAKAIAPTQETAQQKAAGKAAGEQIRKDTAYVDKRLDDRYKRETTRPATVEVGTTPIKKRTVAKKKKTATDAKGEPKRGGVKAKKSQKSGSKAAAKGTKKDNTSNRPASKA